MQGKMLTAWLKGLRRFEIAEVEIPGIEPDQVLVKILKVGICGSDRGMWEGTHFFNELYQWDEFEPGEHGHESSGIVVEVGKRVRDVKEGDLVTRITLTEFNDLKMKCFAEYSVANEPIVVNGGDPEVVCFADPLCVALNHVYHANVSSGDTVLIIGQGFIGLLVTQLLRHQHVNVIATEVNDRKMSLGMKFGARVFDTRIPTYIEQILDSYKNIRAVIECSGSDEGLMAACKLVGRGGTIVIMGANRTNFTLNYTQLRVKGVYVKVPANGVNCKDNWRPAVEILHRNEIEVKSLIDRKEKLVNLQRVLENYESDWLRVIIEP